MKRKTILARVSAWLLTAALLTAGVPATTVSSETDPALADSLLIHYDFAGNTWDDILADKAGDVKTDLSAYHGLVDAAPAKTDTPGTYFSATNGVIKATGSDKVAFATEITDDTKAIHVKDTPSELTIYLRMQVTDWRSGENDGAIVASMRTTGTTGTEANNRVFYLDVCKDKLRVNAANNWANNSNGITSVVADPDGDGWIDFAAVRSAAESKEATDTFTFYALQSDGWKKVGDLTGEAHKNMDASKLQLCLLNDINGDNYANSVAPTSVIDDVRVYNKALTLDDLAEVSNEVHGNIEDGLLIHYDFEGDDLATQLSDKAGDVNSDLEVINSVTYGTDTYTNNQHPTDPADLFTVENGVITATTTNHFCLSAKHTTDVEATYGHADTDGNRNLNATYYLRVKLPDTGPVPFLYNRNMNATNEQYSMHLSTEKIDGTIVVTTSENWSVRPAYVPNQWMEMAVVRDADAGTATLYFRQNAAWVKVSYQTDSILVDDIISPFILFGEIAADGSQHVDWAAPPEGLAYDDVRFYNRVLSLEELELVHKDVSPLTENIPAGSHALGELNTSILNENLLIHYDFEGNTWDEQLSDKAGATKTDLTAVNKVFTVGDDGTVPAGSQMDAAAAQTIFRIDGGVATSLKSADAVALVSGITADTKAIQNAESGATWFMRVQLPAEKCFLLNFRNTLRDVRGESTERSLGMEYDGTKGEMTLHYATGASADGQIYQKQIVPMAGATGKWVDMAWVRSALDGDGEHYYYTFLYKIAGQAEWTVALKDMPTYIPSSDHTTLSLFANAANQSGDIEDLGKFSIDDVRVYNKALTVGELNILTGVSVGMLGAQRSEDTFDNGTTYRVRLVAEISGSDWTRAGFRVVLNGREAVLPVYEAYDSLTARPNGGLTVTVEASEGCHLIAVVIGGIPIAEHGDMTLTVTPYAKRDGDAAPTEGRSVTVTLQDSQIASITWAE